MEPAGGWKVLRQNAVADAGIRQKAIEAVKKSVADGTDWASCFIPRHAVAVTYEKKKYVLIICFQCAKMLIFVDGQQKAELPISAAAKESIDKILDGPGTTVVDDEKRPGRWIGLKKGDAALL